MPNPNLYAQNQDQEIARLRAQRDAIRASLGVTGPGGGTTSARMLPDGKIEGAQYTPQAGYNQQGYKIPAPLSGAGGQANTPPTPYDKQGPPQPVDPRLEEIRKGTAYFEQRNAEGWNTPSQGTGNTQSFNGADLYNQSMALQNGKNIQGTNQKAFPASGKTKAQMDAEAIAPGRQPTGPYNGWAKLSPNTQKILGDRGYTQATFDAPSAAKARELAAKFPLSGNSFKNSKLLDQGIPMVGANAPPTQMQAGVANSAAFAGSMLGAGMSGMGGLPLTAMSGQRFQPTAQAPAAPASTPNMQAKTVTNTAPKPPAGGTYASSRFTQKKGSHNMTGKQLFKLAFLSKCIEDGLTMEQMCERAKQALHFSEKRASGPTPAPIPYITPIADFLTGAVSNTLEGAGKGIGGIASGIGGLASGLGHLSPLLGLAGATAVGAPLAAGYYLAGPASYNMFSKPNLPTREEMMQEELLNEYEKQTKQLKQQSELAKRRKERSKGISGVTRY